MHKAHAADTPGGDKTQEILICSVPDDLRFFWYHIYLLMFTSSHISFTTKNAYFPKTSAV